MFLKWLKFLYYFLFDLLKNCLAQEVPTKIHILGYFMFVLSLLKNAFGLRTKHTYIKILSPTTRFITAAAHSPVHKKSTLL